jgi:3-keto-disaccharide hydrolase
MWLVILLLLTAPFALAGEPKLGPKVKLFNGKNLDGFYTYLEKHGKSNDPDHVFRVEKGAVHVSGAEFGYFITEKEYENYYLRAMFQWGEKTYEPRKDKARDSGVLFHVNGEDKVWPQSIEFQMIEGGTGDIILVGNTSLTVKGETKDKGRFDRFGKGPWKDEAGYRDPKNEVEKPHGQWNLLELWAVGDTVRYHINHKLVNEGSAASLKKGKILFQSEGAELYFKDMVLRPILGH